MNINNIRVGDVIKDYPTLCKLLEIKPTKGAGCKYQLRDFERYCSYHMDKRAFIIDEVYENEMIKPKMDKRELGNRDIYMQREKSVLLNHLFRLRPHDGFNKVELTTLRIAVITGLCRDKYIQNLNFKKPLDKITIITKEDRENFYQRAGLKINDLVRKMLKKLDDENRLTVRQGYKIGEKGVNDRVYWRTADDEELGMIKDAKKHVIKNMHLRTMHPNRGQTLSDVIREKRLKEFYARLNQYVEKEYGWWRIYSIYILGFTETIEDDILEFKKSLDETDFEKLEINSMIAKHFDKEADKKYEEYTSSIEGVLGEVSSVGRGRKVNPITKEWVERQKLLTNDLIRLDENKS